MASPVPGLGDSVLNKVGRIPHARLQLTVLVEGD